MRCMHDWRCEAQKKEKKNVKTTSYFRPCTPICLPLATGITTGSHSGPCPSPCQSRFPLFRLFFSLAPAQIFPPPISPPWPLRPRYAVILGGPRLRGLKGQGRGDTCSQVLGTSSRHGFPLPLSISWCPSIGIPATFVRLSAAILSHSLLHLRSSKLSSAQHLNSFARCCSRTRLLHWNCTS